MEASLCRVEGKLSARRGGWGGVRGAGTASPGLKEAATLRPATLAPHDQAPPGLGDKKSVDGSRSLISSPQPSVSRSTWRCRPPCSVSSYPNSFKSTRSPG